MYSHLTQHKAINPLAFAQTEQWLEAIPVGIVIIDTKGIIIHANPMAFELFTFKLGDSWCAVLQNNIKATMDNGHYLFTHTGKYIVLKTQSQPEQRGQLVLLVDESEIKKNNESAIKIEKINSIGKLSATLAHQLRTPLSTAYLYANNLTVENLKGCDLKNYQAKIIEQLDNIKQQIENVLLVHKGVETQCERLDICLEVELLAEQLNTLYPFITINVISAKPLLIFANRSALIGALNNIIENAIQASHDSKVINISINENGNFVEIDVMDFGLGIAQENINKVLSGFFTTKKEGNGLGLSIAKSIIEAHGGKLSIDSKLNQYTKMTVTLPKIKD
ncbi:MAG: PAS domain-containing sensor histidine kinase [Proteobacteria bacterium]|nr:PAS domain-containing sensor histidine kinase [Pseudomonadota bacterium]